MSAVFSLMSLRVIALLHAFHGIVVILHVEHAQFALHDVELVLILREFLVQLANRFAPGFLVGAG